MGYSIDLHGKNALVTGGAKGMGYVTSSMLAQAGANVFIADLSEEAAKDAAESLAAQYNVKTAYFKCNVVHKEEIDSLVDAMLRDFGSIDILDHIAGMNQKVDFLEMPEDVYDLVMDINAKGTFLVNQAVLRVMIRQNHGKIVNMSSMSGKEGFPTNVAYTAAKFACTGITQAVAKYAAPYKINVNCVCPGIVHTQIWDRLLKDVEQAGGDPAAYWEERIKTIPLGRPQTMEDVASMFLYLSSPLADNITGQSINVSGGIIL